MEDPSAFLAIAIIKCTDIHKFLLKRDPPQNRLRVPAAFGPKNGMMRVHAIVVPSPPEIRPEMR